MEKFALSINQAAELAGIRRGLLYKMIAEGRGPRLTKVGRRSVILTESLRQWLTQLEAITAEKQTVQGLPS